MYRQWAQIRSNQGDGSQLTYFSVADALSVRNTIGAVLL